MTFIEKLPKKEVLRFIREFYDRYNVTPGAGFMAGVYKVTPQTIHSKLNELEADGEIVQIKKIKNIVKYELIDEKAETEAKETVGN